MAIQFARCQYVSRSTGGNACRKAAYNARERVVCDRTGEVFSFSHKTDGAYHAVLLPKGADKKFLNAALLWNEAESMERRKDSQVCKELVLALPDDKGVTLEHKIELTRRFINQHFVDKGVVAQIDIHRPHEAEGSAAKQQGEKNWHAHVLVATRRFAKDGQSLDKYKARDLDPQVRKGLVTEAEIWGEHWKASQNKFFAEKGLDIKVDEIGILPQEHLGPVRMRRHINEAVEESKLIKQTNRNLAQDPDEVIHAMTRQQAVFSASDVKRFCFKHVPESVRNTVLSEVLNSPLLLHLNADFGLYTTKEVREQEQKLLRFAGKLAANSGLNKAEFELTKSLSSEQQAAFDYATDPGNLKIIQGRAGVGKSYVLEPICGSLKASGYSVLGLGPTHKVATDLAETGVDKASTCHSFLFNIKNDRLQLDRRTALVVDEAAMLSTELLVELFNVAKKHSCKLLLVGDERQLPSIERGGMFAVLAEKFGSRSIETVRRQDIAWQRQASENLSEGNIRAALTSFNQHNKLDWQADKAASMAELIKAWNSDYAKGDRQFILAQTNVDVDALNAGIRDMLKQTGVLQNDAYRLSTQRGTQEFCPNDRVQFTVTDRDLGLVNGWFGTIKALDSEHCLVELDSGKQVSFATAKYAGLRHGYAGTVYKAQGATIDKTYVLHDKITNQNNSYVALTRHSQDVKLFINHQDTNNFEQLIQQVSRQGCKLASVNYQLADQTEPDPNLFQRTLQHIKDHFHQNNKFYNFDRQQNPAAWAKQFERNNPEQAAIWRAELETISQKQQAEQMPDRHNDPAAWAKQFELQNPEQAAQWKNEFAAESEISKPTTQTTEQDYKERCTQLSVTYSLMEKTQSTRYKATLEKELIQHKQFFNNNSDAMDYLSQNKPELAERMQDTSTIRKEPEKEPGFGFDI
jgi:Ti-type conjugative transfer relaxase TraA